MRAVELAVLAASAAPTISAKYVWPAQNDFIEDLLAIQSGYVNFGFTDCPYIIHPTRIAEEV